MAQVVLRGMGSEEKATEEAELDEDEQQRCGKHGQEVAVSIQMKIVRFDFPPLSMFPMLENKNVTFSCWHVSYAVALCGRRRAGQSSVPLRWSEGGSIFLTFAMAGGLVNLRPQGGSIFLRFALAGG